MDRCICIHGHFYQPPTLTEQYDNEVFPKKTETMDVRIEQLRQRELSRGASRMAGHEGQLPVFGALRREAEVVLGLQRLAVVVDA